MCAHLLNIIGLVFGMVGAGILFYRGPPQPDFSQIEAIGLQLKHDRTPFEDGTTVGSRKAAAKKLFEDYRWWSGIGVGLVVLAFLMQFLAELFELFIS